MPVVMGSLKNAALVIAGNTDPVGTELQLHFQKVLCCGGCALPQSWRGLGFTRMCSVQGLTGLCQQAVFLESFASLADAPCLPAGCPGGAAEGSCEWKEELREITDLPCGFRPHPSNPHSTASQRWPCLCNLVQKD